MYFLSFQGTLLGYNLAKGRAHNQSVLRAKNMNKQSFTNLQDFYSLSKTLRFELKPVNETSKHIKEEGFLGRDEKKENEYRIIKKIIDDFCLLSAWDRQDR